MATASKPFDSFAGVRPYKIWPGVLAHAVRGESVSFALVELEPNVAVAEHSHPNEQAGFIIQGTFTFTIGGETRELKPGRYLCHPGRGEALGGGRAGGNGSPRHLQPTAGGLGSPGTRRATTSELAAALLP